jgi:hypothetical protein
MHAESLLIIQEFKASYGAIFLPIFISCNRQRKRKALTKMKGYHQNEAKPDVIRIIVHHA